MTTRPTSLDAAALRQARIGVTVTFVVLGLVSGSLASRVPAIKAQLHLSTGSLGIALLGTALGSVLSTPLSGVILARTAPRRWIAVGLVPFTGLLPLATLAVDRWELFAVLAGWGFGMGCVDVAMNTEATRVQTLLGRRILSGIHATFSLGALVGAGIGAVAAATSIGFGTQFVAVGALVFVVGEGVVLLLPDSRTEPSLAVAADAAASVASSSVAAGGPVPSATAPAPAPLAFGTGGGSDPSPRTRALPPLGWPIVALAVIAFGCLLSEGATNDWSAVYIHSSLGASAAFGAIGYAAFSATMVAGRLAGDRLTTRWGPVPVVRAAALLGAASLAAALLIGRPDVALVGFALLGFGLAVAFPLAIGAASALGVAGPSVALVTSAGYLGLLCGPPVIGGLATITSLPDALGLVVALCVLLAALAGNLRTGDPVVTAAAADRHAPTTTAAAETR